MESLNKLKAICEAATPGPWKHSKFGVNILTHDSEFSVCTQNYTGSTFMVEEQMKITEANAAFIAASRSAVPALIELVEALEAEIRARHNMAMWPGLDNAAAYSAAKGASYEARKKLEAAL